MRSTIRTIAPFSRLPSSRFRPLALCQAHRFIGSFESAKKHHDLASFLDYTKKAGLNRESTVFVGTCYEYTIAKCLSKYGFDMTRIGGRSDVGIDLLGTWEPPNAGINLKVLVQCKAGTIGPSLVRELEGTFVGAPPGWRDAGVIAFLVSPHSATKGVRLALGRSQWPMGFIRCSKEGEATQMLWNREAVQKGLEGLGVALCHYVGGAHIVLTHNGHHLELSEAESILATDSEANSEPS